MKSEIFSTKDQTIILPVIEDITIKEYVYVLGPKAIHLKNFKWQSVHLLRQERHDNNTQRNNEIYNN